MRREILVAQLDNNNNDNNNNQSQHHSYNLRSSRGQSSGSTARSPINSKLKNPKIVRTGQITSFFAIRKRRNSEPQNGTLNGKKLKLYGKSNANNIFSRLVPSYSFDDKENVCVEDVIQVVPDAVLETPLGIFRMLPPELLYAMFNRIPVHQLAQLSLSSTKLNTEIRWYLLLADAHRRITAETAKYIYQPDSVKDPFYAWGLLLKACTITMDMRNRLIFLGSFFEKNNNVKHWFGWGHCFMAFCKGWTYEGWEELFLAVMQFSGLNNILSRVMLQKAGTNPQLEVEVRERFLGFFLNHFDNDDAHYGFWNSIILRTQKTTNQQGKLFMIIFGPLKLDENHCEVIDWEVLCNTTIEIHLLCEQIIGPISFGVHSLITTGNLEKYAWNSYHIFNLIEEISTSPNSWTLDNFAAFLALRPQLIHVALHARIIHGHQEEAAHLLHAVNSVLHRWGIFSSAAVTAVMLKTFQALSDIRRRLFLSSFLRTESELLSDALMSEPFDRNYFYMELAVGRAISPLVTLMAANV